MRKIFNKVLAGVTSAALVATLLVGINVTKTVKADDTPVALTNWSFTQGGQYSPDEAGNEGYINSVKMNGTGENVSGWLRGNKKGDADPSVNQKLSATQLSTGFEIDIENTGWDCLWKVNTGYETDRLNPWSIQAIMGDVDIVPGHSYTVSFKAHASKNKYGYVAFACDVKDTPPYGEDLVTGSDQIIRITTVEQTFTYTFTNWVSANKLTTTLMLGAFDAKYDYAGNDVSNIITAVENSWKGTVYVSDFAITDNGLNSDVDVAPSRPNEQTTPSGNNGGTSNNGGSNGGTVTTPGNNTPAPAPTVKKLGKVKKLKVKNYKKGAIKITWKKVTNAKSYQIKVGKKTYTSKKATKTVKKLKKGKKYTVKVRAKAAGYKTGSWATKKIKIRK